MSAEPGRRPAGWRLVLELGKGSGALAVRPAADRGARAHAVDVSRAALVNAWPDAVLRGRRLRVRDGDLTAAVVDERSVVIVSNPPYVPAVTSPTPSVEPGSRPRPNVPIREHR